MRYLLKHWDRVGILFIEHCILSIVTLFIALCIAVPIGIIASKNRKIASLVTGILGVIYTIPGLALLSLLVPIFGLGAKTSLIALIAYAQVILVRNIIVAVTSIEKEIIEAAKGMGMSKGHMLLKIKVPLALPIVISGIRIASISIINLASIAAFINGGGLGEIILEGIRTNNLNKTIAGTIALGILMLIAEGTFRVIDHFIKLKPRG